PWARPRRRARRARRPRNRPVPAAPPPHPRPLDARSFFGSPPPCFPLAVCSEFGVPNIGEHTPPPPGGAGGSTEPFRTVRRRRASRLPARHPRARPAPTRRPDPPISSAAGRYRRNGAARLATMPRPRPPRRPGLAPPAPRHGRSSAPRASPPCTSPPRSVPPGVGAEREGALGAASALNGVIGHDAVEEPVAAARVGG